MEIKGFVSKGRIRVKAGEVKAGDVVTTIYSVAGDTLAQDFVVDGVGKSWIDEKTLNRVCYAYVTQASDVRYVDVDHHADDSADEAKSDVERAVALLSALEDDEDNDIELAIENIRSGAYSDAAADLGYYIAPNDESHDIAIAVRAWAYEK